MGKTVHGKHGIPEYFVWKGMKDRCHRKNNKSYPRYGGKGIRVCDEWRNSFLAFFENVGPRPTPSHSIDRMDHARGYEPGNVRWATITEQNNNRSSNHNLTVDGVTMTIAEWAREYGIDQKSILARVDSGWSAEDSVKKGMFTPQLITHDGETHTITEWEKIKGCNRGLIRTRIKLGWSVKDAIETSALWSRK
jgi:hypothetical protein